MLTGYILDIGVLCKSCACVLGVFGRILDGVSRALVEYSAGRGGVGQTPSLWPSTNASLHNSTHSEDALGFRRQIMF